MKILVLNGPNLNLLGTREPEVYGTDTLEDIKKNLQSIPSKKSVSIDFYQSNSENELIDRLHEAKKDHVEYIITVSYTHLTLPTNREV